MMAAAHRQARIVGTGAKGSICHEAGAGASVRHRTSAVSSSVAFDEPTAHSSGAASRSTIDV